VLLAIDIGNTTTVLGAFDRGKLLARWTLTSGAARTADEVGHVVTGLWESAGLRGREKARVVIASVVPPLTRPFEEMAERFFGGKALVVSSETVTGIEICYKDPSSVGADRIANAVAASRMLSLPCIVVDLGTATTFDVVARGPRYLGGAIAPGLVTSAENLFSRGAKLFPVELRRPPAAIGRTTEESLLAGIVYGVAGQVDRVVEEIVEELGEKPCVVGTGGYAGLVAPLSRTIGRVVPSLTLEGLRMIAEMNF